MTVRRSGGPVALPRPSDAGPNRAVENRSPTTAAEAPTAAAPTPQETPAAPLAAQAQAALEAFAQGQGEAPAFQASRPHNALNAQLAVRLGLSGTEARYNEVVGKLAVLADKVGEMKPEDIQAAMSALSFPEGEAVKFLWTPEGNGLRRQLFDLQARIADIAPDTVVMQHPTTGAPLTLKESVMVARIAEAQFLDEPLVLEQAMRSYAAAFPQGSQSVWINKRLGLDEESLAKKAQAAEAARLADELKSAQVDILAHGMLERGPEGFLPSFEGAVLRDTLVRNASVALASGSFQDRNALHAAAVADEAALLAAHAVRADPAEARRLHGVFEKAALAAGAAFEGAFRTNGEPIPEKEADAYKPGMKAAGGIALSHLAEAIGKDPAPLLKQANIGDVAEIVKRDLGLNLSTDTYDIIETLRFIDGSLIKDDYSRKKIPGLKPSDARLPDNDRDGLNLSLRLANVTWKAGQVHRAAWEGDRSRIDPDVRTAYNPYDQLMGQMFNETKAAWLAQGGAAESADHVAFARVVLEAYKDLDKLQRAVTEAQG